MQRDSTSSTTAPPDPSGSDAVREAAPQTSLDKALDICEALAGASRGLSVRELARTLAQPVATVHRLLAALKRRGYVRQDEETARYALTLRMLDLSFKLLGRSEIRLHAYPVVREHVLRRSARAFVAAPSTGDVTYIWPAGADAVSMHTVYGRQMPGHCALYFDETGSRRRLSCMKLESAPERGHAEAPLKRFGAAAPEPGAQRLNCCCAPVRDYSGREVARVGVFAHGADDRALVADESRAAWDLAARISMRLGHLPVGPVPAGS